MAEQPVDIVFEGGGVKGIGLAGDYRELYDTEYRPRCVAGTSAGAITASLVVAGYTGEELEQLVLNDMNFGKRGMARPGIEPGTPRFSVGHENPWLSPDLQDFFW